MKSKRMFEINPRHPMIVELNNRIKDSTADDSTKDMVISLYLSGVIGAGYQLTPEDAMDFSERVGRMVTSSLGVAADAELAPELEIPDEESRRPRRRSRRRRRRRRARPTRTKCKGDVDAPGLGWRGLPWGVGPGDDEAEAPRERSRGARGSGVGCRRVTASVWR